jgi:uncharacterized protein (DUF433 family)
MSRHRRAHARRHRDRRARARVRPSHEPASPAVADPATAPSPPPAASPAASPAGVAGLLDFPKVIPGETDDQFRQRAEALRAELAPETLMEAVVVRAFLDALQKLRQVARQTAEMPLSHLTLRAEAQADHNFWRALREVQALLKRREDRARQEAEAEASPASQTRTRRKAAPDPEPEPEPEPEPVLDPAPVDWRERVVLDPARSIDWPVVRGTNVTAEQVWMMLLDGWPVSKILRYFPDITLDDVRACRDCAAEGMIGPYDD